MVKTTQPHTCAHTREEDIDISFSCYMGEKKANLDARDYLQILVSLYNNTNNLRDSLQRLDTFIESVIFDKEKEKSSPQTEPVHL